MPINEKTPIWLSTQGNINATLHNDALQIMVPDNIYPLKAQITAYDGPSGAYSWQEVISDDLGNWTTKKNGLTGSPTLHPAFEDNSSNSVPIGAIVDLYLGFAESELWDFQAVASVSAGGVNAITVVSSPSGYTSTPTVTITAVDAGSGASAVAVVDSTGIISAINVITHGSGYINPPIISSGGPMSTTPLGYGYDYRFSWSPHAYFAILANPCNVPTCGLLPGVITRWDPVGCAWTDTITSINVSHAINVGYQTILPDSMGGILDFGYVLIVGMNSHGASLAEMVQVVYQNDAQALAVINSNGTIGFIYMQNAGQGYTSVPQVFIDGDGYGATAVALVAGGSVYGVSITNVGSDYTKAVVYIDPSPSTSTAFMATFSYNYQAGAQLYPAQLGGVWVNANPTFLGGGATVYEGDLIDCSALAAVNLANTSGSAYRTYGLIANTVSVVTNATCNADSSLTLTYTDIQTPGF